MKNYFFETDFEANIGGLEIFANVEISFNYSSFAGNGITPPEDTLKITETKTTEVTYYLDHEEITELKAVKYYDDYTAVKFEEVLPEKLHEFIRVHLDLIAEGKAEFHYTKER